MIRRRAFVTAFALPCLLSLMFLLAAYEPTLADCCSGVCYARSRRLDLSEVCTRDPKYWDDDARQHGYQVGKTPRVGAIAVFEAGVQGADWGKECREAGAPDRCYGHVAYVEEVRGPVAFVVSEKGWSQDGTSCEVHSRTLYSGKGVSFIYEREQVHLGLAQETSGGLGPALPNGAPVVQGGRSERSSQRWEFVPEGDYFKIVAKQSGKCLEVSGGSHANGAKVVQWDCYGGDNQRWRLIRVGDGYRFVAKHSEKCLDVSRAAKHEGAPVIQWQCHGGGNQLWKRVPRGDGFAIVSGQSGRSIEVREDSRDDDLRAYQPDVIQKWRFAYEGGYHRIVAQHSGKCLDVSGAVQANGAAVMQWECNGGDNQLWELIPVGDAYRVVAKHSGRCLDVSEASHSDGAAIIQWDCNGGQNQLWRLVPADRGFQVVAKHSGKPLNIVADSQTNGAGAVQWGSSEADD